MDDDQLSFEALAIETMEMSLELIEHGFSFKEELPLEIKKMSIPETTGILYRLEKGISTFCVRAIATSHLAEAREDLNDGHEEYLKNLKITELAELEEVQFFETENQELAEILCDELSNRRFPIKEDVLCNVSDPGFSWWLDLEDDHFQVFFKSHSIHRADNYIRLGPLGDSLIAGARLKQAESIFRIAFPVGDFASTDRGFAISTTDAKNKNFIILKNIFLIGENATDLGNFPATTEGKTLYYYFKELATLRRFWLELEKQISE